MEALRDLLGAFFSVIKSFRIVDLLDILLVTFIIYKGIKLVRETKAEQLVKGIVLLAVLYFIMQQFGLRTMSFIMSNIFQLGIMAIFVVFQPELRRALEKLGRTKVSNLNVFSGVVEEGDELATRWRLAIETIGEAVQTLSQSKTGALIVIERQTKLGEQILTGTQLDATPSAELFGNIFFPNSPLHDGAVIVRDGKVLAAGCFLPKPQKEERIAKNLGSRHRAAIGMSEDSDALIVVVSEETGMISVAENGQLYRGYSKESLTSYLSAKLLPAKQGDEKENKGVFRRFIKNEIKFK